MSDPTPPENNELNTVLAEVRATGAEARALTAEVRADRATVDAYRAEVQAWRTETRARFDSLDQELQNLAQVLYDHLASHSNGEDTDE